MRRSFWNGLFRHKQRHYHHCVVPMYAAPMAYPPYPQAYPAQPYPAQAYPPQPYPAQPYPPQAAPVAPRCPSCGTINGPGARFCQWCGGRFG